MADTPTDQGTPAKDAVAAKEDELLSLQARVAELESQLRAAGSPLVTPVLGQQAQAAQQLVTSPTSPRASVQALESSYPSTKNARSESKDSEADAAVAAVTAGASARTAPDSSSGGAGGGAGAGTETGGGGGAATPETVRSAMSHLRVVDGGSDGGDTSRTGFTDSPASLRPQTADSKATTEDLFVRKVAANMSKLQHGRQPVVLVCPGTFNPVHLQHARIFYLAREWLQCKYRYQVVGGLMSPKHDSEVKAAVRSAPASAIPAKCRVDMCELAVANSSWLGVDHWGVTRKVVLDFPSVLRHIQQVLNKAFPKETPQVMYLCGADALVRSIGRMSVTCVCVARPGFMEELNRAVGKKHRALVHVVDDDHVLTSVLDSVSSTKVRRRLIAGKPVADMVGTAVQDYITEHDIASKCRNKTKWRKADKAAVVL